ncbi:hypothetical protein [Streptomyces sp. NPDC048720]|uniref:hypothetical protein n=1 Tax=Streptomyces sp. NPDC048720 TaxID=3365588 RepID=UPI0037146AE2
MDLSREARREIMGSGSHPKKLVDSMRVSAENAELDKIWLAALESDDAPDFLVCQAAKIANLHAEIRELEGEMRDWARQNRGQ